MCKHIYQIEPTASFTSSYKTYEFREEFITSEQINKGDDIVVNCILVDSRGPVGEKNWEDVVGKKFTVINKTIYENKVALNVTP